MSEINIGDLFIKIKELNEALEQNLSGVKSPISSKQSKNSVTAQKLAVESLESCRTTLSRLSSEVDALRLASLYLRLVNNAIRKPLGKLPASQDELLSISRSQLGPCSNDFLKKEIGESGVIKVHVHDLPPLDPLLSDLDTSGFDFLEHRRQFKNKAGWAKIGFKVLEPPERWQPAEFGLQTPPTSEEAEAILENLVQNPASPKFGRYLVGSSHEFPFVVHADPALQRCHLEGISSPLLYIGQGGRTVATAHQEDFHLGSTNLTWAGWKIWLTISPSSRERLERILQKRLGVKWECSQALRHSSLILSPLFLRENDIDFRITVCGPGDLISLGPGVYHQVVNSPFVVAEAVNALMATHGDYSYTFCHGQCPIDTEPLQKDHFAPAFDPAAKRMFRGKKRQNMSLITSSTKRQHRDYLSLLRLLHDYCLQPEPISKVVADCSPTFEQLLGNMLSYKNLNRFLSIVRDLQGPGESSIPPKWTELSPKHWESVENMSKPPYSTPSAAVRRLYAYALLSWKDENEPRKEARLLKRKRKYLMYGRRLLSICGWDQNNRSEEPPPHLGLLCFIPLKGEENEFPIGKSFLESLNLVYTEAFRGVIRFVYEEKDHSQASKDLANLLRGVIDSADQVVQIIMGQNSAEKQFKQAGEDQNYENGIAERANESIEGYKELLRKCKVEMDTSRGSPSGKDDDGSFGA